MARQQAVSACTAVLRTHQGAPGVVWPIKQHCTCSIGAGAAQSITLHSPLTQKSNGYVATAASVQQTQQCAHSSLQQAEQRLASENWLPAQPCCGHTLVPQELFGQSSSAAHAATAWALLNLLYCMIHKTLGA